MTQPETAAGWCDLHLRVAITILVLVALTACTATHQYKRAAHELAVHDSFLWCWTPSDTLSPDYHGERCDPSDTSLADEAHCRRSLANLATRRPELAVAKQELEACMHDKGWSLYPAALLVKTVRMPSICNLDDYPPEQCPGTAEPGKP